MGWCKTGVSRGTTIAAGHSFQTQGLALARTRPGGVGAQARGGRVGVGLSHFGGHQVQELSRVPPPDPPLPSCPPAPPQPTSLTLTLTLLTTHAHVDPDRP